MWTGNIDVPKERFLLRKYDTELQAATNICNFNAVILKGLLQVLVIKRREGM